MKEYKKNRKLAAFVLASVTLLGMLLTACGGKQESAETTGASTAVQTEPAVTTVATTVPAEPVELAVNSIEEQGEVMVVDTTYGQLKYPFAFADLIQVEAVNDQDTASLVFSVKLDLSSYRLFTITFGQTEGILLGTMLIPNAQEPVPVYADLGQIDTALSESFVNTFYAAQESFNDVLVSLLENEGFTAVQ